jgi:hypothetical protein
MRWYLRLTTVVASLFVTIWAFPGCSSNEGASGKMDSGAMPSGKMEGAMDKGNMEGGAMPSGKMEGAMDKGKMEGAMDKVKMDATAK